MTAGLGHLPAKPTSPPTLKLKFVDKLFDGQGFALDPIELVLPAIAGMAPAAAAEGGRLGSGGATVPHRGAGASTRPVTKELVSFQTPAGSSTVKRWSLLHRIQRLCRPEAEGERGPAVVGCGMPGHEATNVNIHLRASQNTGEIRAGVSGIYRCGSPWLCPVCAVGKAHDRAERVRAAANATFERGGMAALVVLTASHSIAMSLAEIKALVQGASSAARKGRAWTKAVADMSILGVIVGQEVTYSRENGWHYHQHLSVMVDGPNETECPADIRQRAEAAGTWIAKAYTAHVRAAGGTVSDRHGWHVRVAADADDASNYTAKGSMAWEIAGGHKNETKAETSITPWDIAVAASNDDRAMFGRWREYMDVMPGTRSCVVSAALARKLGITAGKDDDDGEQVLHDAEEVVGRVEAPTWKKWLRHGLAATFLSRVEFGGEEGFTEAVTATNQDSEAKDAEYQRRRTEIAVRRQMSNEDRATAAAETYARTWLRNHAGSAAGRRDRIAEAIRHASDAFPLARPLNPSRLVKSAA